MSLDSKIWRMGLLFSSRYSLDIMSSQNSSYSLRISLSPLFLVREPEKDETTEIGLPNPGFGLMRVANTPLLATRIRERDFCRSQAIFGKYGFLAPIPPYAGCQIPGWQPADTATGNLLSARIGGNYFREPRFSRSCSLTRLQPLQKKKSSREYPLE